MDAGGRRSSPQKRETGGGAWIALLLIMGPALHGVWGKLNLSELCRNLIHFLSGEEEGEEEGAERRLQQSQFWKGRENWVSALGGEGAGVGVATPET